MKTENSFKRDSRQDRQKVCKALISRQKYNNTILRSITNRASNTLLSQ